MKPIISSFNKRYFYLGLRLFFFCLLINGITLTAGNTYFNTEKGSTGLSVAVFDIEGADQNPIPRRTVPLAKQYGKELAAAVDRVLDEEMKKLQPAISTAYSEIDLAFSTPPSKETLMKIEKETEGYQLRWASNQLETLRKNGSLLKSESSQTGYGLPSKWESGIQNRILDEFKKLATKAGVKQIVP